MFSLMSPRITYPACWPGCRRRRSCSRRGSNSGPTLSETADDWTVAGNPLSAYWTSGGKVFLCWLNNRTESFSCRLYNRRNCHIRKSSWLTAFSSMTIYLLISSYIRKPFLIYDFATSPSDFPYLWGKFSFLFYQCAFILSSASILKSYNSLFERSGWLDKNSEPILEYNGI
jgi:hypothetical protein